MMGNTCLIHNLSRQVSAVTGKNEWSCLWLLGREIAAVFGRSVQVNVLYAVPLLIPSCFSLAYPGCVCAGSMVASLGASDDFGRETTKDAGGGGKRDLLFPVSWKRGWQSGLMDATGPSVPGCSKPALLSTGMGLLPLTEAAGAS